MLLCQPPAKGDQRGVELAITFLGESVYASAEREYRLTDSRNDDYFAMKQWRTYIT